MKLSDLGYGPPWLRFQFYDSIQGQSDLISINLFLKGRQVTSTGMVIY